MSASRPYRQGDDFDRLLALVISNAAPRHVTTATHLRFFLGGPGYQAATDLFVAPGKGDGLLAARDVRVTGRGDEEVLLLESWEEAAPGAPVPVRAALLGAAEARGRTILREQGRWRGIIQSRCDADDTVTAAMLTTAGMSFARPLVSMRRPNVDDIPPPVLPDGITLRPYRPGEDDEAWVAAFNESFADHWGGFMGMNRERWQHYLAETTFDPAISLVAVDGTAIAGFCHGRIDPALNALNRRRSGMIRYVGVRPTWRGIGLGSALTRAGMHALRDAGMTEIVLGVDAENVTGAHLLYERLGFAVVERQAMYRKTIGAAGA